MSSVISLYLILQMWKNSILKILHVQLKRGGRETRELCRVGCSCKLCRVSTCSSRVTTGSTRIHGSHATTARGFTTDARRQGWLGFASTALGLVDDDLRLREREKKLATSGGTKDRARWRKKTAGSPQRGFVGFLVHRFTRRHDFLSKKQFLSFFSLFIIKLLPYQ